MYTCSHCKKKFHNVPYISSNSKKYCSYECIPNSGLDQPYSFEYFTLMDSLRDIEISIKSIKTLEDRIEVENEIEDLSSSYTLEIFGDYEGLFYKRQIGVVLDNLNELYDKVNNIFMKRKYTSMPFVLISWEDLKRIIGEEDANLIFDIFKDKLDRFIFDNVYFTWQDYKYNSIDFSYESKLIFATMDDANHVSKLFLDSFNDCFGVCFLDLNCDQLEELDIYTYCIDVFTLHHCVVCGGWELWECFKFYDNLKLYKCDEHCGCEVYDHLYQSEF